MTMKTSGCLEAPDHHHTPYPPATLMTGMGRNIGNLFRKLTSSMGLEQMRTVVQQLFDFGRIECKSPR